MTGLPLHSTTAVTHIPEWLAASEVFPGLEKLHPGGKEVGTDYSEKNRLPSAYRAKGSHNHPEPKADGSNTS